MSTLVVGHSNLDSVDAMVQEVLAQVMAAGQEIIAKEMARKYIAMFVLAITINSCIVFSCNIMLHNSLRRYIAISITHYYACSYVPYKVLKIKLN